MLSVFRKFKTTVGLAVLSLVVIGYTNCAKFSAVNQSLASSAGLGAVPGAGPTAPPGETIPGMGSSVPVAPMGPLKASTDNPRYYAGPDGRPIYLAGFHHQTNRVDLSMDGKAFDFAAYLNLLKSHHANYIRLWAQEDMRAEPTLYLRTGPGNATDGKPKFDLTQFNPAYFKHLRERVIAARNMGMYVNVMLFNGADWVNHPYNVLNSIHSPDITNQSCGIVGYPDCGIYIYQSYYVGALPLQQAYAKKVVETLNDLDNVIYEMVNQPKWPNPSPVFSFEFSSIMSYLKAYEATLPLQHPFHMSSPSYPMDLTYLNHMFMFDWYTADKVYSISPYGVVDYQDNPVASSNRVIIVNNQDSFPGFRGGDAIWVWKQFLRGNSVTMLDSLTSTNLPGRFETVDAATAALEDSARAGILSSRLAAELIDLRSVIPHGELSSTGYALAQPGHQYLVFAPAGNFTVDLSAAQNTSLKVSWIDLFSGTLSSAGAIAGGSATQSFTPPLATPTALLLSDK
jgi:hypothetical protein